MCLMLYVSALMVTVFCWLVVVRARTNPPRGCLIAELTDSMSARLL